MEEIEEFLCPECGEPTTARPGYRGLGFDDPRTEYRSVRTCAKCKLTFGYSEPSGNLVSVESIGGDLEF